jgi:two-component system, response regulator, stage 0 sporulation protein F
MARILVVEDEHALRMLYRHELELEGYEVDTAGTADEGIGKVREEDFDLVLLDIRMPGKDGLEALGDMLSERRDVKVIINSAYSTYKDNFMTWAAEDYVVKSSDLTELKQKIGEVLAR